jgi:hypothetical protein
MLRLGASLAVDLRSNLRAYVFQHNPLTAIASDVRDHRKAFVDGLPRRWSLTLVYLFFLLVGRIRSAPVIGRIKSEGEA